MLAEALQFDCLEDSAPAFSAREPARLPSDVAPRRAPSIAATSSSPAPAEPIDDAVLVNRARRGDDRAFEVLVLRHRAGAVAVARGVVRNEQDALEIVQEAFLRAHRNLDQFSGQSTFFTWLYRIVSNVSIDWTRRPSRRFGQYDEWTRHQLARSLQSSGGATDPERAVTLMELRSRLANEIEALPSYHRGVIVMRELRGLSYEQMAREMGVSKGTIMSRLFHARRKLQEALGDDLSNVG